ncbi:alpha-amylase family protein [Pengzhenrongella phosphoraccumulans]|uniref:alpha-amylase family protein n=1 Tax=Pengzhenrongella phosphoraccumulans TaxID=3114394 RepID=UPI00388E067B
MSAWADHAIWWHIYPLGFTGAPHGALAAGEPVQHRLGHLEAWLDYVVELGTNGLLLGPIFASETHGYDTIDYLRIDPRLGDDADFDALVAAAHSRGLKIMLDGVFNHVGRGHPRFAAALADGPDSPAGRWFRWEPDASGTLAPAVFEGHGALVTLNHDNPEVAAHITAVMGHWLDRGADAWRLDAAYAVPAEFWQRVLPAVRAAHPDVWVMGEVIHGDYPEYVAASGVDSVTQYELWKALWSSVLDGNFFELAWALTRHDEFALDFLPLTFAGNHDVTRIASRITDPRHVTHVLAVLFLVAGAPSVYSGDEQGFVGVKEEREGGDDAIRPQFPPDPTGLAPQGWAVYREHQRLIGLHRNHAWLARARTTVLHVGNEELVIGADSPDGNDHLVLALNLSDGPFTPPLALGERLLTSGEAQPGDPGVIAAHSWAVYETAPG